MWSCKWVRFFLNSLMIYACVAFPVGTTTLWVEQAATAIISLKAGCSRAWMGFICTLHQYRYLRRIKGCTWWVSTNYWMAASRKSSSEYSITFSRGSSLVRWGSRDCCFARSAASAASLCSWTTFRSLDSKLLSLHHLSYAACVVQELAVIILSSDT